MVENYKDFIEFCESLDYKPRLLLHSCCGPCSSWTMTLLAKYFNLDIYYTNDNIYPREEFDYRLSEQKRIAEELNLGVNVIEDGYDDKNYYEAVKGKENLGEHSLRCYECYKFRMIKTAKKAKEMGYEYFTTTLSISPYKNSTWINEIGYEIEKEIGIKFLYSNFKKADGYKKSIEFSKEHDLYRQDYCGCVFSYNERREEE